MSLSDDRQAVWGGSGTGDAAARPSDGPGPATRSLAGARVLVVGLGRFGGGVGVTRWLAGQGARVTVTDQADADSLAQSVATISDLHVDHHLGGHESVDLTAIDLAVINPAIDKRHSVFFSEIRRRGVPWTTEINLFCERCPAWVIGVTGSYGKSTTSAMLATALQATFSQAGRTTRVFLGGNIGGSLLADLGGMSADDVVVLEMSNAQLEDLPRIGWAPPLAVITNVFPHHLDRYDGPPGYFEAKLNIVRDPARQSRVIVGRLHPMMADMLADEIPEREGRIRRVHQPERPFELSIPGGHNQSNAACALEVCLTLGHDETIVRSALSSFPGLPHRLQHVRTVGGVDYFNDSKATAPPATVSAAASFDQPVVVIVGGQDKGMSFNACAETLVRTCRAVVCTGESGPAFAEAVRACAGASHDAAGPHDAGTSRDVEVKEADSLEAAVTCAASRAQPGDVVLFAPGAPSFDAYANFTQRGDHFVRLVTAMPG